MISSDLRFCELVKKFKRAPDFYPERWQNLSHKVVEAGSLKVGRHLVIEEDVYKVVSIEKSKSGKHGHAKARITAVSIFDGSKKSIVLPTDTKVDSPVIDKRVAQVNYITDATPPQLGLMDMESYESFEVPMPDPESFEGEIEQGIQIEYWIVLGRRKLIRRR
jgi:translation initiation factor 5A